MITENKISGWLWLFVILLPFQLIQHMSYVVRSMSIYLNKDFEMITRHYGVDYANQLGAFSLYGILSSMLLFIGMFIVNVYFFKKKKGFVSIFMAINIMSVLCSFISEFLTGILTEQSPVFMTSILLSIFIGVISYALLKSKKVRIIFVK